MRTYNRPMFRKGGMTNQGSGILSHVEPKPLSGYRPIPKMPLQHLGYADGGRIGYQAGGAGGSYVGNYGISPSIMQALVKQNSGGAEDVAIRLLMDRANPSKNTSIDDLRAEQKQWINYGTRYGKPQATFQPQFTHPIHRQGSGISSLGAMTAQQAANGGRIGFGEGIGPNAQYAQNFNDINWNTEGDPYGVGSESPIYNEKPPRVAGTAETTTTAEQAAKNAAEAEVKAAGEATGKVGKMQKIKDTANKAIDWAKKIKNTTPYQNTAQILESAGKPFEYAQKGILSAAEAAEPYIQKGIQYGSKAVPYIRGGARFLGEMAAPEIAAADIGLEYAKSRGNKYEESLPADVKEDKNKTQQLSDQLNQLTYGLSQQDRIRYSQDPNFKNQIDTKRSELTKQIQSIGYNPSTEPGILSTLNPLNNFGKPSPDRPNLGVTADGTTYNELGDVTGLGTALPSNITIKPGTGGAYNAVCSI